MRALAILAILALPARAADTWLTTRAGNFIVYTNTDAARAIRTAEALERMRAALALTTDLDTTVAEPIRVFLFRTTKDYAHYGQMIIGAPPQKDGISIIHPITKAILLDGSSLRTDALLQHELAHHFARQTWKQLPLWLDEGIAEFYATLRVRGDLVEIGRAREQHRRTMRRGAIPMREFLSADVKSSWYAQQFNEKRFYAQAWLLVHWLMIKRQADIGAVAEAFLANPAEVAVPSLFQINVPTLQRELLRYNQLPALPSRQVKVAEIVFDPPDEPRALAPDEIESMFTWTQPVPEPVLTTILIVHETPEQVARYDEAANKVARGELAAALKILDELIPGLPQGQLLKHAKTLREQVAEIVRKNRE